MSYTPLSIGTRAYKYIRSGAVKSIVDALIELITNSHDAYNNSENLEKPYKINIFTNFEKKNKINKIIVIDQAIGMSGEEMIKKLLQVGDYTSSFNSRGFFSRGAKDISNISNVLFESIKNNKYSSVEITSEGLGRVIGKDLEVTSLLREKTKIIKNGLKVTMDILDPFKKMYPNQLFRLLRDHYSLREILKNDNFLVNIKHSGITKEKGKDYNIKYLEKSNKKLLADADFIIPKYNDAPANLKIYSCSEKTTDQGILLKSSTTVYGKTCFDRKNINHPYLKYICGELVCDKIHELLYDFDANGSSEENPYCLLDHSRGGGLIKSHPFISELFRYPGTKLRQILNTMENIEESVLTTQSNDISDLINKLNLIGNEFELGGSQKYSWRKNDNENIIKAVDGLRNVYVKTEKNYTYIPKINKTSSLKTSKVSSGKKIIKSSTSSSKNNNPIIYERDENGELKKLTILETGELVDYDENADDSYQMSDTKSFEMIFSIADNPTYRYDIYETLDKVVLRIYTKEPIVESYLGQNPDSKTLSTESARTFLSELIIDAFSTIMTKNQMEINSEDYDSLNTLDMINVYDEIYDENVLKIEGQIKNAIDNFIP